MNTYNSHAHSSIDDCHLIDIAVTDHKYGSIAVMENSGAAPFKIKRVYYVYDVPAGVERGGHSHKSTYELVVPLCGSFDVVIDDGLRNRRITLNSPAKGLILSTGIWRTLDNFSCGAICLVMASEKYDESDYIREYEQFKKLTADKI